MTKIIMELKRSHKIIASIFLLVFTISDFTFLFIPAEPVRHGKSGNPVFAFIFLTFLLFVMFYQIFNYAWIRVEADLYKIKIIKVWGGETVLFYQDYIIETATAYGKNNRASYFMRFTSFESDKTYLIPSDLKNFKTFTIFLLKNGKITGES